jgi:hypothetical protein
MRDATDEIKDLRQEAESWKTVAESHEADRLEQKAEIRRLRVRLEAIDSVTDEKIGVRFRGIYHSIRPGTYRAVNLWAEISDMRPRRQPRLIRLNRAPLVKLYQRGLTGSGVAPRARPWSRRRKPRG